jgi:hypothetical protein
MAYGSSVPGCLNGLVAAFAAPPSDVTAQLGPVIGNSSRKAVVLVGWDDVQDLPSVETRVRERDAARARPEEAYTVNCVILVASGSTGLAAPIARAFQILGFVGGALAADKTLAKAVTDARLADWSLDLGQVAIGAHVRIPFSVAVTAVVTA